MSPEQARGEAVDGRSDLFSLGSVLYAMATGRPPFRADTSFGVLRRITDTEPRAIREINPDIPAWLAGLIDKLLAKAARTIASPPPPKFPTSSSSASPTSSNLAPPRPRASSPRSPSWVGGGDAASPPSAPSLHHCPHHRRHSSPPRRLRRALLLDAQAQPQPDSAAVPQPPATSPELSPSDLDWNLAADEINPR